MSENLAYKKRQIRYSNPSQSISSERLFDNQIFGADEDENNSWLTTKKASTYLGISPNALRILVHRGKVEAFKLGAHLRFSHTALQALLIKKEY